MILGLLGAVVILVAFLVFAYALSLAMTFWFISVPAIIVWFFWYNKRYHRIQRNLPPEEKARRARDVARWQAQWAREKEAKARRKAMSGR